MEQQDLYRAQPDIEMRDGEEDGPSTLVGHFATFGRWTEIHSWYEGDFMERIAPGAFAKSMAEQRERIKVLFDHGHDPQLGNKPLGRITDLREDGVGAAYEVELIDTDYNRDFIVPAVRAGLLGASFRFSVIDESWNDRPERSEHNPGGLRERTIQQVRLFEFGPVTFPAYPDGTTVGMRSMTDHYIERSLHIEDLLDNEQVLARAVERFPFLHTLTKPADADDVRAVSPAAEAGAVDIAAQGDDERATTAAAPTNNRNYLHLQAELHNL
jgi:HK97 family phage prohead protease